MLAVVDMKNARNQTLVFQAIEINNSRNRHGLAYKLKVEGTKVGDFRIAFV